jgi:uncharacterized protein with gpF-like domain
MKFDLAQMIRRTRNPRRTRITLRPILPTATMAGDLYAASYKPVITTWQAAIATIAARYAVALPVKDGLHDSIFDLDAILAAIDGSLQHLVIAITPRLREWGVRAEQWHRGRWKGAVLAGTGIDPQTLLGASDVSETVQAFVSRNVQLIRSVSDETRSRVSDIVLRGYAARTPLPTVAKEMAEAVDLSRKRALRIASDQNSKLSAGLDRARQEQAGITQFAWHHSYKRHPRPWHQAREGKVYDWDTLHQVDGTDQIEPGDNAGQPPFCGCRTRAVIDLS